MVIEEDEFEVERDDVKTVGMALHNSRCSYVETGYGNPSWIVP